MMRLIMSSGLVFVLCWAGDIGLAFGDCSDRGYMRRVLGAPVSADFDCVEALRFSVTTASGPREIRAIYDAGAPPSAATLAGIEAGITQSIAAMPDFGPIEMDNVTIFIGQRRDRTTEVIEGEALTLNLPTGSECAVVMLDEAVAETHSDGAVTVAHELFHCVLFATVSNAPNNGLWWVEGAPETFAAYAVSNSRPETLGFASQFENSVRSLVPLYRMSYENIVLFSWVLDRFGPDTLIPRLRRAVAAERGAGADSGAVAMRAAFEPDELQSFAEAVADNAIPHPQGGTFELTREGDEIWAFRDGGAHDIPLPAFVLRRGQLEFRCGAWSPEVTPGVAPMRVRPMEGDAWGTLPWTIDTEEPESYRMAAISAAQRTVNLVVRAERTRSCLPCAGVREVDACLVGTWQMTGGGPVAWMKSQGLPITSAQTGPQIVAFQGDGIYATEPFKGSLTMELSEEQRGEADIAVTVAVGRWSVTEGTLNICQDSGGLNGQMTARTSDATMTRDISQPGQGELSQGYSCSEDSLSTTMAFPGMPAMTTEYTRIGPAPVR